MKEMTFNTCLFSIHSSRLETRGKDHPWTLKGEAHKENAICASTCTYSSIRTHIQLFSNYKLYTGLWLYKSVNILTIIVILITPNM